MKYYGAWSEREARAVIFNELHFAYRDFWVTGIRSKFRLIDWSWLFSVLSCKPKLVFWFQEILISISGLKLVKPQDSKDLFVIFILFSEKNDTDFNEKWAKKTG